MLKFLTAVDEFSRVVLSLSCGRSLAGFHVIRTLEMLLPVWGATDWHTHYTDPGSPWQNPLIESLNSIFRTTFLNRWCFLTLAQTKAISRQWLEEYNEIRPHGSLGDLLPLQFLRNFRSDKSIINKMKLLENLNLKWTKESGLVGISASRTK